MPDAVSGGFEAMTDFMNMDDEGRREINRRVNARRQAGKPVSFSYAGPDGVPTSLATEQTVKKASPHQARRHAGSDAPFAAVPAFR